MSSMPFDEDRRLDILKSYAVLDTPPEPIFDQVTRSVARLFNVPVAIVSLIDRDRVWFKSGIGVKVRELRRSITFCAHAIMQNSVMVVPDTTADPRFKDHPFVVGRPGFRFYAGAPLVTSDGYPIGALCIMDAKPREMLTAEEQECLSDFAAIVVYALDYRRIANAAEGK